MQSKFPTFSLSFKVFLMYFALLGIAAYWAFNLISSEIKPTIRQATEETLVEMANLLAEIAVPVVTQSDDQAKLAFTASINRFLERQYQAEIFGVKKEISSVRIYITDKNGIVIFDSTNRAVGQDYSQWNDVYLTLQGKYGARSTKEDPLDETSSVMHVAAPVKANHEIIGVLTVAKTNRSLQPFYALVNNKLKIWGGIILALSLIFGAMLAYWLTGSIRQLVNYAQALRQGEDAVLPEMNDMELKTLADAIKSLRQSLMGKTYIEQYLVSMTHEMKSPLAGIVGAGELLTQDMPPEDFARFVGNIRSESSRLQSFIESMLQVSRVESLTHLKHQKAVNFFMLVNQVVDRKAAIYPIQFEAPDNLDIHVNGDEFLLSQAIENLITNAIDFSASQQPVTVKLLVNSNQVELTVFNQGEPIPDYAMYRIYDRFYSLSRPGTGKRSTGLGLTLVKRVAELHGGTIQLVNTPTGVSAIFTLSTHKPHNQHT